MALTNRYIGITPGQLHNLGVDHIVIGTSSTSTTWLEVRIMTNDGTNATNVKREDVRAAFRAIEKVLNTNGITVGGGDLPDIP